MFSGLHCLAIHPNHRAFAGSRTACCCSTARTVLLLALLLLRRASSGKKWKHLIGIATVAVLGSASAQEAALCQAAGQALRPSNVAATFPGAYPSGCSPLQHCILSRGQLLTEMPCACSPWEQGMATVTGEDPPDVPSTSKQDIKLLPQPAEAQAEPGIGAKCYSPLSLAGSTLLLKLLSHLLSEW